MRPLGKVYNKATAKYIDVFISETGAGFMRLTGAISQDVKDAAFALVKERVENGVLFNDDDMKLMDKVEIT
jgi:hypothetical protein